VIRVFLIAAAQSGPEWLEELLQFSGAHIIGRSSNVESAMEDLPAGTDIVLVDSTNEPSGEYLEALQESGLLRDAQVVLVADESSPIGVQQAMRLGVKGILPSGVTAEQLGAALAAVSQGLAVLHPSELQTERTAGSAMADSLESVESLTPRERQVLQMLARGLGNKEIAARLKISDHTAKFHVASILGKLGAASRTEAVSIAMRRGLLLL
jgi:NarL family two-component system response regulator YdfI